MTPLEILATTCTIVFFLVILSYYALLFLKPRPGPRERTFSSVTVIIPARNEERLLGACIASVQAARFRGTKEIIVVDDASIDGTARIARSHGVRVLRNATHAGKAASLNRALKLARSDLIAVVDADSVIGRDALTALARVLGEQRMGGAAAVVKARNREGINLWVHLDLIYGSLLRSIFSKVHANIVTPGALSMYRADALRAAGGFSTEGYSEDIDIAIRLIRNGYRVGFAEDAVTETVMPTDPKGFFRQRTRFARGMVSILKRHLSLNGTIIDLYTLPLFLFTYLQAIIMSVVVIAQIASGYLTYFASNGVYMSWGVARFLFEWFSIVGTVKWAYSTLTTPGALTFLSGIAILAGLLTYPLFLIAILRYDRRLDLRHAIPLLFMFPFWLLLMLIYMACTPELFRKRQYNRWKKNE